MAFAAVYLVVGALLIYWKFTSVISTEFFGIGMLTLIIASLIFKIATDFLRSKT